MLGNNRRRTAYQPVRVLVADDSVLDRRLIQELLSGLGGVEVVATARDGQETVDKVHDLHPDVVMADIGLPGKSGVEIYRELQDSHTTVILLSNPVNAEAEATIDALFEGAFDFVMKPTFNGGPQQDIDRLQKALRDRIAAYRAATDAASAQDERRTRNEASEAAQYVRPDSNRIVACNAAVALGVSTGGPGALRQLLATMPDDFPSPILIVHPMPAPFTRALALRLNEVCDINVREASNGDFVLPRTALLAPGGRHMEVDQYGGEARIRLADYLPIHGCRPSIDRLFRSVADVYGPNALGVVLSGLGSDGTAGSRSIRNNRGTILAQDDSAVVNEMPQSVIQAGAANRVGNIDALAREILARTDETTVIESAMHI